MILVISSLTIVVALIQIGFIRKLISLYNMINLKQILPKNFEKMLYGYIKDEPFPGSNDEAYTWIKNLSLTIGREVPLSEIKDIFRADINKLQRGIRLISNLGPAVGLFFTFSGLLLTLYDIYQGSEEIIFKQAVGGLYPVIIGSALGMVVYGLGNILYKKSQERYDVIEEKLLGIYLRIENEFRQFRITKIEDVYQNLFKPVNTILNQFEAISKSFSNFNIAIEKNIENHNEKFQVYMDDIASKTQYNLARFEAIISDIRTSFDGLNKNISENMKINSTLSKELADKIGSYQETFKNSIDSLNQFSSSNSRLYDASEKIENSITEFLNNMILLSEVGAAVEKNNSDIVRLADLYEKNTIKSNTFLEYVEKMAIDIERINEETVKPLLVLADSLKKFPADLFNHIIIETKNMNLNLRDLPENLINKTLENKKICNLLEGGNQKNKSESYNRSFTENNKSLSIERQFNYKIQSSGKHRKSFKFLYDKILTFFKR